MNTIVYSNESIKLANPKFMTSYLKEKTEEFSAR